jgi:hypothetical protein
MQKGGGGALTSRLAQREVPFVEVSEYVDDRDSKKQRVKVRSYYLPRGHKLIMEE